MQYIRHAIPDESILSMIRQTNYQLDNDIDEFKSDLEHNLNNTETQSNKTINVNFIHHNEYANDDINQNVLVSKNNQQLHGYDGNSGPNIGITLKLYGH